MGAAKLRMMELEEQREVAKQICVDAGVLLRCPYHDEVHDNLLGENTPAYRLGNYRFSNGDYGDIFSDRRDMTDAIDWVVRDAPLECPGCDRLRDD